MTNKIKENAIKIAELKNEIPKKVPHTFRLYKRLSKSGHRIRI